MTCQLSSLTVKYVSGLCYTESCAAVTEDLKVPANKAFPKLQGDAKEQLALTQYLGQLGNVQVAFGVKQKRPETLDEAVSAIPEGNVQVAFGVKQKRPKTLDEAVSATLELESYLHKPRSANCNLESSQAQVFAGPILIRLITIRLIPILYQYWSREYRYQND